MHAAKTNLYSLDLKGKSQMKPVLRQTVRSWLAGTDHSFIGHPSRTCLGTARAAELMTALGCFQSLRVQRVLVVLVYPASDLACHTAYRETKVELYEQSTRCRSFLPIAPGSCKKVPSSSLPPLQRVPARPASPRPPVSRAQLTCRGGGTRQN